MTSSEDAAGATDAELTVVGVAASAGGVGALEQFFASHGESASAAFVVVAHLMADLNVTCISLMDALAEPNEEISDGA